MRSIHDFVQACSLFVAFLVLCIAATAGVGQITQDAPERAEAKGRQYVAVTAQSEKTSTLSSQLPRTEKVNSYPAVAQAGSVAGASTEKRDSSDSDASEDEPRTDKETPKEIHQKAQERAKGAGGENPVMTRTDKREILWLARIVYSETKRAHEQRLVAWVVRNRVDTGYKGSTYESVAKHSNQFSGLNPGDARYDHNMSRYRATSDQPWRQAMDAAKRVYFADDSERPLAITTRHFYSPVAVASSPRWARNRQAVRTIEDPNTNQTRFAFFDKVR